MTVREMNLQRGLIVPRTSAVLTAPIVTIMPITFFDDINPVTMQITATVNVDDKGITQSVTISKPEPPKED